MGELYGMMREYNSKVFSNKYPKMGYVISVLLEKLKHEYSNSIISDAVCYFIGIRYYILIEDELELLIDYVIDSYDELAKEYRIISKKPDRLMAKDIVGDIIEKFYKKFFLDVLNLKYSKKKKLDFYDEVYEAIEKIGNYEKHCLGKSKFEGRVITIYYDPITKKYELKEEEDK